MSVAFRREFLGVSAIVRVDAAFGADLTTNSAAWTWTDITADVLYAGYAGVTINPMGRSDESSTAQPSSFTFAVKNDTGNYTVGNPSSTYYPNVRRNTPIRVVINLGAGDFVRAQGYANGWIPSWDERGSHSTAQVSCSGTLRRLQQGSPVIQSAMFRSVMRSPGLVNYAPMEEESGASNFATYGRATKSKVHVLRAGTVQFGADTTFAGVQRAAILGPDCYLSLDTSGYGSMGGHWQFDWYMKFTGSNPATETIIQRVYVNGSTISIVDAVYGGGNWGWRAYTASGVSLGTSIFSPPTGQATGWWHWRLMAHDGGSGGAEIEMVTAPVNGVGFIAAATIGSAVPGTGGFATIFPSANLDGVAMSSWVVYDNFSFSGNNEAADGYGGENAIDRLERLCREESIEITAVGNSDIIMGPQKAGSIAALIRECETADGGVLFDGRNAGLSYIAESSRYNVAASMMLFATSKEVIGPPTATHDDQRDLNRATVTLTSGGSETYQQFSGALGSDAIGVYETSLTANLFDADAAFSLAAWRVHLGQVDGLRYPGLSLDLIGIAKRTGTSAPTSWLGCTVGSRIDVAGLRTIAPTFPPGTLSVLMEGWSETITPKTWKATVNASPYGPWNLGSLDTNPADCGASVTGSTMTTSSTTVDVLVSDACDWSHSAGNFSVTIGGEEMTVTAVSATAATTPALVATGTAASSSNAPVSPGLPGGATAAGNLLLMFASCRDTNAVDTDMYITGATGWKKIIDGVNFVFFAKVHSGSETTPTVSHSSAITGDTMIAQIVSFNGKWGDPKSQLVAVAQQLNASAQDIGYPALPISLGNVLLIWAGWKADDWTSVATLGGVTEISEAFTTAGNDAGQVWDYNTSSGVPTIAGGSFVVTGGTAQISRGCTFALRSQHQTFTVTRGVNGITRAHPLGEEVHVTNPLTASRQ